MGESVLLSPLNFFDHFMNKIKAFSLYITLCFILVGCKNDVYDIDMIYISGGDFMMGSEDADADLDERPIHSVYIKDFYIGKYEVTQDQWKAVMGRNLSQHRGSNLPVTNVSWDDCQKFIEKLNSITGLSYRLPTEAEWEYVASMYCEKTKGVDIKSYAWYLGSFEQQRRSNVFPQEVGSLNFDSMGIYDIIGNVNEWCSDSYDSLSYLNGFSHESDEKVFRGGCYANQENYLRPTNRNHIDRHIKHFTLGFRLAMDATP